jgi:tellurite resistance protein
MEAALQELTRKERLILMRFVCSFVWADLEVKREERELVARLIRQLKLDEDERGQVLQWLESPPTPESVDPELVPKAHRAKFLRAVEATVAIDGEVSPEERDSLSVFAQLIR